MPWRCSVCTLINEHEEFLACECCGTVRKTAEANTTEDNEQTASIAREVTAEDDVRPLVNSEPSRESLPHPVKSIPGPSHGKTAAGVKRLRVSHERDRSKAPKLLHNSVPVFTVGHSNKGFEHLQQLLQQHQIQVVVDVRSKPSAADWNAWVRVEEIQPALKAARIGYEAAGQLLGGKPGHSRSTSLTMALADHSSDTCAALRKLGDRAVAGERLAMMCAEEDRNHCHRNKLSAWLVDQGYCVAHIVPQPVGFTAKGANTVSFHRNEGKQVTLGAFFQRA